MVAKNSSVEEKLKGTCVLCLMNGMNGVPDHLVRDRGDRIHVACSVHAREFPVSVKAKPGEIRAVRVRVVRMRGYDYGIEWVRALRYHRSGGFIGADVWGNEHTWYKRDAIDARKELKEWRPRLSAEAAARVPSLPAHAQRSAPARRYRWKTAVAA